MKRISPAQAGGQGGKGNAAFGGKATAFQMFYPASQRLWRRSEETEEALRLSGEQIWEMEMLSDAQVPGGLWVVVGVSAVEVKQMLGLGFCADIRPITALLGDGITCS